MAVTIKRIAELAGVSAGTVDRALNDRGRVNPDVAKRIKCIAKELNYQPNKTARTLHIASKNLKIAVILHTESNLFFEKVLKGINKAANEISQNGIRVDIFYGHAFKADCQLELLKKAEQENYNAIILVPIEDDRIKDYIASIDKKTPVFLLSNPLSDVPFCEYIGCDYSKSGELAAGIVNIIARKEGENISFFSPSFNMLGHKQRYTGFTSNKSLKKHSKSTDVIELENTDKIEIYKKALTYFSNHPDVSIVIANAMGLDGGILKALEDSKLIDKVKIIAFDYSDEIKPYLQNETITACIDQGPSVQGYKAVISAFNSLLFSSYSENKMSFVDLRILLKESV